MNNLDLKHHRQHRRVNRIRARLRGTAARPRLAVTISNRHVVAQLIDDDTASTLAYVSSVKEKLPTSITAKAEWVGTEIAKLAKSKKITQVVFDRHGHLYHGRIKVLAEAARKSGLEF